MIFFRPGTEVTIDRALRNGKPIEAVVTKVNIEGDPPSVSYFVAFWVEETRYTDWVEDHEVTATEDPATCIILID